MMMTWCLLLSFLCPRLGKKSSTLYCLRSILWTNNQRERDKAQPVHAGESAWLPRRPLPLVPLPQDCRAQSGTAGLVRTNVVSFNTDDVTILTVFNYGHVWTESNTLRGLFQIRVVAWAFEASPYYYFLQLEDWALLHRASTSGSCGRQLIGLSLLPLLGAKVFDDDCDGEGDWDKFSCNLTKL